MAFRVLAFALGVIWVQLLAALPESSTYWAMATGLVALLLGYRACQNPRVKLGLSLAVCLLLGCSWALLRAELRLSEHLSSSWEGRDVEVQGVITGLPERFSQGHRFAFEIQEVLTPDAVVPRNVMLSWYQGRGYEAVPLETELEPGAMWRFVVRLKRPHGNANPHGFDYEAWLLERNIRATGYVRPGNQQFLGEPSFRVGVWIEQLRLLVRQRFERALPESEYPYVGILVALVIGDQKAIQGDFWNMFNRTGVTHLFSVSGLHVTMVAALLGGLAGLAWRRSPLARYRPTQQVAVIVGWGSAVFYALLAGFSVPTQRTLYMLSVAAMALLSGKPVSASRTLALALGVVLLIDPWAVLAAGFWLSFGAVGALIYVSQGRLKPDVPGWWQRLAQWGQTQWAATLATLPVLLLLFQQFSLVSPFANALAIPLISLIVTPLALAAGIVSWPPLLYLAHGFLVAAMAFLKWCAQWPVWYTAAPPWWAVILAVLGAGLLLLPRGIPGWGLGVLMLAPAMAWRGDIPAHGEFSVTVLDVGQGLATLVETSEGATLYDTGPMYSAESDAGQRVVVPFLRARGVRSLETLIVTHKDTDHSGGAHSVLAALPVRRLITSMDDWSGERCLAGQSWTSGGVLFRVLHPTQAAYDSGAKPNARSCVLHLSGHGGRMLLTSDIEAADESALLERGGLASDIMLVPHHGSKTSSSPAFLEAVGAAEAVVPVGYRNRFGHPVSAVLARYEQRGMRIWRTDAHGAVTIRFRQDGRQLIAWRHEKRRYWHGR